MTEPGSAAAGRLSRLHAALVTPYAADEAVSHDGVRRLVAHVLSHGIGGTCVGGSTDDGQLAGLAPGADGGIGSTCNVPGARYIELWAKLSAGDLPGARAIQSRCNAVIDELVRVGVFRGMKLLPHRLGVIDTPVCRRPLATLSPERAGRLAAIAEGRGRSGTGDSHPARPGSRDAG